MKYNLINTSILLAENTAETRYDLITGGTDSVTIDFFPRLQVLLVKGALASMFLRSSSDGLWHMVDFGTESLFSVTL